jgi:hypothetical protein
MLRGAIPDSYREVGISFVINKKLRRSDIMKSQDDFFEKVDNSIKLSIKSLRKFTTFTNMNLHEKVNCFENTYTACQKTKKADSTQD